MKKKNLSILGLCLIILLLVGCGTKPDEVALQLVEAVNAQDLDGALVLFTEDAVVTSVSPEPFIGKAEIQGWLEGMYADNFHLETEIVDVNGDSIIEHDTMTMDSMSFYDIDTLTGTSEISIEGGKIKTLNFSFSDETLAALQTAPFVAPEDLIGMWTVGTFLQFNEDGTFRVANKIADLNTPVGDDHPGNLEAWSYDGMVMTIQLIETAGEEETCSPNQVGTYFVRWAGDELDRLKFEAINDPCAIRKMGMQWGNWLPVTP